MVCTLQVLMETVETLQAGGAGEREQRVVSLTAQLLAARSKEAMQERRAEDLLVRGAQPDHSLYCLYCCAMGCNL